MAKLNYIKLYSDFKKGNTESVETALKSLYENELSAKSQLLRMFIGTFINNNKMPSRQVAIAYISANAMIPRSEVTENLEFLKSADKELITMEQSIEIIKFMVKKQFDVDIELSLDDIEEEIDINSEAKEDAKAARQEFDEIFKSTRNLPKEEKEDQLKYLATMKKHQKYYADKSKTALNKIIDLIKGRIKEKLDVEI